MNDVGRLPAAIISRLLEGYLHEYTFRHLCFFLLFLLLVRRALFTFGQATTHDPPATFEKQSFDF